MKKIVMLVILLLISPPFSVFAKNCDANNVMIKSIEQIDKSDGTGEKSEATIENNEINLDISMSEVGDYIQYRFNVDNKSDEDLTFNEKNLISGDSHFNYAFRYGDNSNIIKSHTNKAITLTVTYARAIAESEFENGVYQAKETKIGIINSVLVNPKTSNYIIVIVVIISGISLVVGLSLIKNKYIKTLLLICCLIPTTVYALCSYQIKIFTNIEVSNISGPVPVTDTIYWALQDNNNDGDYEKLVISNHEVTGSDNYQGSFAGNTEFTDYREVPWNSQDYYGGNSKKVEEIKIEGLVAPISTAYWFGGVGYYSETLEGNLNDLNVSNVTNMKHMFRYAGEDVTTWNIGDLSRWDTSNVTNMYYMFFSAGASATTWDIGDLSGWKTSNVTDMGFMFNHAGRNATTWNIGDISRWDTSNVINMGCMFRYAGYSATIWNIGDLGGWNTSSVEYMDAMFEYAGYSATTWNIKDLSRWDTSHVKSMQTMFNHAGYNANTFELDLSGWNTSSITYDLWGMFDYVGNNATTWIVKIPPTNGLNINNDTTHFYGSGTLTYSGQTYATPPSGRVFTIA